MATANHSTILRTVKGNIEINPGTRVLDDEGRDWAWMYVIFDDVPNTYGYSIGSDGTLWTARGKGYKPGMELRPWSIMHPSPNEWGYLQTGVRVDGKSIRVVIHTLVLNAFVGPRPDGMECCHNNGNSFDNRLANLRWGTPESNLEDKRFHGTIPRGSNAPHSTTTEPQVIRACELLCEGLPPWQIARAIGVSNEVVHQIRSRLNWNHISKDYEFPVPIERNRARGTQNHNSVLDEIRVRKIRRLASQGVPCRAIAEEMRLNRLLVNRVILRATYANVE